ncbi:MAG: glycogen/starch/alpha-glucan phosphorylase [Desulfobulbaceae bacterium]|nr:glycogen/starch/alpha-glucan phosphorylase [Desulfobulbaceae bacterium]
MTGKNKTPFSNLFQPYDIEGIKTTILNHLLSFQGRDPERSGNTDLYKALSYTMRDLLIQKWITTQQRYYAKNHKRVYYLSLEFLIGRSLGNSLINLGLDDVVNKSLANLGFDLFDIREEEEDAALGNGGLGRLAACFMDSIATMRIPAYGYGINYEYGLFHQKIINGFQVESPDNWLRFGTPWEYERLKPLYPISFKGSVHSYIDYNGRYRSKWVDTEVVMANGCDLLIPGYMNDTVINIRLWSAKASRELDLFHFGKGDYIGAVENKVRSETISKLLYPSDEASAGRELRLKQQYFFVAATLQDIFRRFEKYNNNISLFHTKVAIQLNDTHPAIAIPELMRLLLDDHDLEWEKAWDITVKTFAYTNHTLMPEALETWPVPLMSKLLPRHMEIIFEINKRFLTEIAKAYPNNREKLRDMSIIEEGDIKNIRMAYMAIVGSHSVNGVAALHTELLKAGLFKNFHDFFPHKINNKTNGITPRRWLLKCNKELASLINATIGKKWITNLDQLKNLLPYADDTQFQKKFAEAKKKNKILLANFIETKCGVRINPNSLFDVQVKRIHEYKRQLLNLLHVITLYHRIISDSSATVVPRTVIFAGKGAPSYHKAKLIIKMINSVAEVINNDSRSRDLLSLVFIPNYGVSLAEKIIPAADLSEQISTAGTEASGTGNMKFALNGALTIGTLDGANIEILNEVGKENIFIFGMNADEIQAAKSSPSQSPRDVYNSNPEIKAVIDLVIKGHFSKDDPDLFQPIINDLMDHNRDPYLHLLDMESYLACQHRAAQVYKDPLAWYAMAIRNVANMGKFSSDRTIKEYAEEIWGIELGK